MKKTSLFVVVLLSAAFAFAEDDCTLSYNEAKQEYNKNNFAKAKELFLYVQDECGATYGNVNAWIQKCDDAINHTSSTQKSTVPSKGTSTTSSSKSSSSSSSTATLTLSQTSVASSASGTSVYISVTSNRAWEIQYPSATMYTVTKSGGGVMVKINANTGAERSDYFNIRTTDGTKTVRVNISQSAGTSSKSSDTSNPSATLSVSKTSIYAPVSGMTEYITVTSNRAWEIQYASGSMYTATRSGNSVKVVINANTSSNTRQDWFNIKTSDGSKTIKISLSQGAKPAKRETALRRFNRANGVFEVDWFSIRGALATATELEMNAFGLRWGFCKIDPCVVGFRYDFLDSRRVSTSSYYSRYDTYNWYLYYQPTVKFFIPWSSEWAVTLGAAPLVRSWGVSKTDVWFMTELGVHYHWGYVASSDFFMRYDGGFVIGASINFSTGF